MALFRKMAARKAKFGFIAHIRVDNFIDLAEAKKLIEERDHDALIVLNFNMGADEFKVYTDNDDVGRWFEATYCVLDV